MADDYRVQLDIYNGPLDLLLFLIRREEVDIYDIPIAKITDQYVSYVELLRAIDPNAAGEFLVMAATLMEIKSRLLLPRAPAESEEELVDPRLELVRQLLEYKSFKDAADRLRAAAEDRSLRFGRQPAGPDRDAERDFEVESLHLWDLVEAFREVMAKTGRFVPHEVLYDDTPIALHAADLSDRLEREGRSMTFADVFEGRTRSECIGLFLALLELVRQRRVRVEQDEPFGPIILHLVDPTPIEEPEEVRSIFAPATDTAATPATTAATPASAAGDHAAAEPSRTDPDGPTSPPFRVVGDAPDSDDTDETEPDVGEMPEVPDLPTNRNDPEHPSDPTGSVEEAQPPDPEQTTRASPTDPADPPTDAPN